MDLNAPLGMEPPRPRRRIGLAVGCLAALGALAGLLRQRDDCIGLAAMTASIRPPGAAEPADEGSLENGVRVHRGASGPAAPAPAAPAPLVIDVTRQLDAPPKPRVTAGAAARPADSGPRIAIYVGGLGVGQAATAATQAAIDTLPAGVTLAFLPYAAPAAVDAARSRGHEVLLQLPMQNTGGGVPGPHALKPDAPPAALAGDLAWSMTRLNGYAGIANLLGAPVTADAAAMTAVLRAAGARNLFFLDDGTSKRSLAASLGPQMNVAVAQADLVLDATNDPAVVRANLDTLMSIARRRGRAIGMASGLPDHLPAIARFASELANRNIALVPVSALARHDPTVATSTR